MQQTDTQQITAYIGLGSNLAEPIAQIKAARRHIADLDGVQELAFSNLYQSAPMGPPDQPDYVNAVMAIATKLAPMPLLRQLQAIENAQGRVRQGERWGARTLDLDILLYGQQQIALPDLVVPHTGMTERAFVLYPLNELDSELIIPGKGALADVLAHCPMHGLHRLT
ncbi:MAG: 2-amino-4-hydroxy-6-hydroxymethyldihydropteridine diphosphokinase [Methylococcales bacterium]